MEERTKWVGWTIWTTRSLIDELNRLTKLYDAGHPEISDKEWDELYFKLQEMEKETGIIYPDSPTQNIHFEKISELKKVKHNHPMLSLDKTKEIKEVESFIKEHNWVAMAKMDGLTCSLRYVDGKLVSAETRGNGIEGEDITHNALIISSIPNQINYEKELIIDGEIICTYKNFENFDIEYKNPRNFASGSIRLLDSKECAKRKLAFIAWDVIKGFNKETLTENLIELRQLGFIIVPLTIKNSITSDINSAINFLKEHCELKSYPIDGIVFKYDNIKEYKAAGRTDHHFKGGLAYKFYDKTYETNLKNIEWTMGRTGILTPVAIYDDVEIDGTICNRASLHNYSIMKELFHNQVPMVNQKITIIKSNQIIPQVKNVKKYEIKDDEEYQFLPAPIICPYCGKYTKIKQDNDSQFLYCDNPLCEGKLINRLEHFCGKKGLDIKGLSKATFQKLIDWEWLENLEGVFNLNQYRNEWIKKSGFGIASVDKILKSIEEHKRTTLDAFISAIGIPLIGRTAAKDLTNYFETYEDFRDAVMDDTYNFFILDNFGEEMNNSIKNFDYTEADRISKLLIFEAPVVNNNQISNILTGKTIVITGKLTKFKNRAELKTIIESYGGKVADSISNKTNVLINNDINSSSSKNKKAKNLGIPIISETDFIQRYLEN